MDDAKTARIYECAKRLIDGADFQLGGTLSSKSKTRDIPSKAFSQVKARHLASLRDAVQGVDGVQIEESKVDNTLKFLLYFYENADFDPAWSAVQDNAKARFVRETGESLPPGFEIEE